MKQVKTMLALLAVVVAMWSSAATRLLAQANEPAVIVTVASVDEMMADITWVTQAAGVPQFAAFVTIFAGNYTQTLDKTKPGGVLVSLDASGQPTAVVGFIPVKNLQALLGLLSQQFGQPTDAGNGVQQLQAPQGPLFVKEANGFAFLSNSAENLSSLPADPVATLSGLEKKYNIAATFNIEAIPAEARADWLQKLRGTLNSNPGLLDAQRQQLEANFAQLEQMANESEQIVLGFAIDAASRSIYFDINMTAKPGTALAAQMNDLANAKTDFAGFIMPGAAAQLSFSSTIADSDKQQSKAVLDGFKQQALNELDEDQQLPTEAARSAAKRIVENFFAVMEQTINEGVLDAGAVLMLDAEFQFAAGARVADGSVLNETFKELVQLAQEEENFPDVKLDAATHGNIVFHSMTIPVDDLDAQMVIGETVELYLGTGPKAAYVAFGKNSLDLVKRAIDSSAQSQGQQVLPMQLIVSLTPFIRFASQFQEDATLQQVLAGIEAAQGRDHFSIVLRPEQNGFSYRIELEDGVLKAIGSAIAAQMQAQQGGF